MAFQVIRCDSCGAVHPLNTVFCDECGYRLSNMPIEAPALRDEIADAELVAPIHLSLLTPDNVNRFECALTTELFIGRTDLTARVRPDVDLSPLNAIAQGVSRRHARLLRSGQAVLVEDLGSINGTFVRGTRLAAHQPHDIQSGDVIQFGRAVLKIVIDGAS